MLNVFPSSLEADERREGLRRFREREAVRLRNEQAAQEFLARPGLTGLVNDNIPPVHGAAQRVHAEQPVPMDEDEIAHKQSTCCPSSAFTRSSWAKKEEGTH
jgi:hypothetical protein